VLESACMSTTARRLHYTYAEYLALEDESPVRHEYLDGEIYAMAGGSPDHAALAAAVIGALAGKLPPACRSYTSDLRVRIEATGLSTYPDVAVVCGRTRRAADDALAVVNPVLLAEARSLGIPISATLAEALRVRIVEARHAAWLAENDRMASSWIFDSIGSAA